MNVILIVIDTLRADHLSCYDYDRETSPRIDRFAAEGVRVAECLAHANATHPSFTTLLTGRHPLDHGIVGHYGRAELNPDVPMLGEILRDAGYLTAAVDNLGLWFERGFEIYDRFIYDMGATAPLHTAEEVSYRAIRILKDMPDHRRPFFLFLHYWDPHTPYLPPPPYDRPRARGAPDLPPTLSQGVESAFDFQPLAAYLRRWLPSDANLASVVNRYDGEISYLDASLGDVFDTVDSLGLGDDTLIALTADHGESLGEHGIFFDHRGLYAPTLRVPLILRWPSAKPGVLESSARHLDIVPTILDFALGGSDLGLEGLSLRGAVENGQAIPPRTHLACEASWQVRVAFQKDRWKLIAAPTGIDAPAPPELYDLNLDPLEEANRAAELPSVLSTLTAGLEAEVAREMTRAGRLSNPLLEEGVTLRPIEFKSDSASLRDHAVALLTDQGKLSGSSDELSPAEQALVDDRLRQLGYLGYVLPKPPTGSGRSDRSDPADDSREPAAHSFSDQRGEPVSWVPPLRTTATMNSLPPSPPNDAGELSTSKPTLELLAAHVDRLSYELEDQKRVTRELSGWLEVLQSAAEPQTGYSPRAQAFAALRELGVAPPDPPGGFGRDAEIARLRAELLMWQQHWANLQGTAAWRIAMALRGLRRSLAPDGSLRAWLLRRLALGRRG